MPQGLQVFDSNGKLILDYTENTYQIFGKRTIVGSQYGTGRINDSRIKADNAFIIPYNITLDGVTPTTVLTEHHAQLYGMQPEFTISDGSIEWKYGSTSSGGAYIGMSILYGGKVT